jgi:TonB-linked SusC/RagA family outer membrane protein
MIYKQVNSGRARTKNCIPKKWFFLLSLLVAVTCNALAVPLTETGTQQQTRKVTGKVFSAEDSEPVIGASVLVEGTSIGAVTDLNGTFTLLNVPSSAQSIRVSFAGMKTQTVPIRAELLILLEMDEQIMDEVIVVAYGTTTRGSFTGAASKITSQALENRPISNLTQALSGVAPGVQVGNNSGQPGTGPTLRIRGISSINDANDPLYVVDGSPYENALSSLNTEDIESITILKDAVSASLYGARASAGVVIITTKNGKKGQPKLTVKASQSFSKVGLEFYDLVDDKQFYELNWEKLRNSNYYGSARYDKDGAFIGYGVPADVAAQLATGIISRYTPEGGKATDYKSVYEMLGYNPYSVANNAIVGVDGKINPNARFQWPDDTDWANSVRQLGLREEYTVSYSGASDKTDYFVSTGYLQERGYMKESQFNRSSIRLNVNSQITNWLKTGANVSGNISDGRSPGSGSPYYYPLYTGPIYPVHLHDTITGAYILDSNGKKMYDFGNGGGGQLTRPINSVHNAAAELPEYEDKFRRSLLGSKIYGEAKFLKDFTFTVNYSADLNTYYSSDLTPNMAEIASPGELRKQTSQRLTWDFNQLLGYKKDVGKFHVNVLGGHEAWSTSIFDMHGTAREQMMDGITELNNFSVLKDLGSYTSDYRTEAYLFKGDFVYDDKYFLSLSGRYDGSSKFFKDVRWAPFYGVGVSWRMDREDFLAKVKVIDMLKLRASWGSVGNSSGVGYYAWQALYGLYPNAGVPGFAISPTSTRGNKDLHWETNINFDAAVEFSLLKRFSGTLEYFNKASGDMLYSKPLNPSTGFSAIYTNAFSMVNRGVEVELAADIIRQPKDGFRWKVSVNGTHYKNEITHLTVEPYRNGTKRIEEGHSLYDFNLRHFIGVDPDNGLAMYTPDNLESADVYEKNGQFVTNDINNTVYEWVGSAIPKVYGGLRSTLSYKGFDLTVQASYQFGGKTYDANYRSLMTWSTTSYGRSMHVDMLNRWQKEGDITNVPRLDATDGVATNQAGANSDRWLVSNNYFELTAVNLNYNLPKKWIQPLGIEGVGIYFNGDLLYRWTARKGLNVRYSYNGTVDDGYLPAVVYTVGLNLKF